MARLSNGDSWSRFIMWVAMTMKLKAHEATHRAGRLMARHLGGRLKEETKRKLPYLGGKI